MEPTTIFIIIAIAFIVICYLPIPVAENPSVNAKEATKDSMIYDASTQTLTVKARCAANRGALEIVADRDIKTKYEPKRLVYTGATVGGITTGGFHEEGGYNYISSANKTGKYNIYYIGELLPIQKIELSNELVPQAKKSEIKPFLNNHNAILLITSSISSFTRLAIANGSPLADKMMMEDLREGFPTLEKCEKIINWICGN